ncbi:UDP-N-acetylmuramate: L-alanyl-gamma-D-glutamyl-meso-diaminopimelate ligase (plasmid) [Legionella adelaidensis]|uniref:UDP-N-acetylmuramate--L-alanyl-gamma-D-glutamyl-meso-2,6-diaminoheptandioate ligase n=1 Tax=Legionella adelaidensis TaxID=45056 RepID=A0A0W0R375_9GAMM|nr:UDP-N-acetylmuramate:L-alanyl-gamma-D-glutamyl-meso-diaminopimelate ligase [Legionella adelaidensis]KTC65508.1 UDP-N-acetylmuramate: L-alanyl-gamma-D-glutamyl-meso-diaminopimelate ligase [Legionella adelaidensis]VEH84671.1 UDP-N-acetylmuramate: L-alanyl-gamma-D-glutamyl-meso-diaminopimelate ligase [Legionella adelaidensis]
MHLHILGISGTFMSALAILAREAGYTVTGSDEHCYPPISDLLRDKGIEWTEGYSDSTTALKADCVIVGNAIKRGMPVMEAVLNARRPYISGPQWLAENILSRYKVLAVSGTHGKTTTTSMLAFILHYAGLNPGFLIGGVSSDFKTSAHLGEGEWFVIEADEYDSAFFDKRPKFIHYHPEVAILNNLEFDHADIYSNLEAIQQQFHYFLKTIPGNGLVIKPKNDTALNAVIDKGCYCPIQEISLDDNADWRAKLLDDTGSRFEIWYQGKCVAEINWSLIGQFNVENALAALAASNHAGVEPAKAAEALMHFTPVKRRLEIRGCKNGITIYDDFAHHPTAIRRTLEALKNSQRHKRINVVLEFASYTMRTGVHSEQMTEALRLADQAFVLNPHDFDIQTIAKDWPSSFFILATVDDIVAKVAEEAKEGDAVLVMSNRGFGNIHQRLIENVG